MEEILKKILSDHLNRKSLIKVFQENIWNNEGVIEKDLKPVFLELAYDLDFYEPDINLQKESASYYGDDRLEEEINLVLEKMRHIKNLQL